MLLYLLPRDEPKKNLTGQVSLRIIITLDNYCKGVRYFFKLKIFFLLTKKDIFAEA